MQTRTLDETAPSSLSLDPAAQELLYRKVILRTVPLFFLGFIVAYIDRVNISLAKLQMQADFGLTDTSFSIGASIFFWGYMVCEIPSNLILRRIGARAWLARIMITWGLVSMLMIFSRDRTVFYSLRLLLGICEAGFVPGVLYFVNTWLPPKRQSGMFSLFLMALPISIVIGAPLSGWILGAIQGVAGLKGWQWLFVLEGMPSVLLGIAMFALVRNKPADVSWLTAGEKHFLASQIDGEAAHKTHRIADALLSPAVYLLILIMLLFNTGFYGLTFWMPTMLANAGVSDSFHVGLTMMIPFGMAAIVMVLTARLAERTGRQRLCGTVAVLLAAAGLFLATLEHDHFRFALAMLTVAATGMLSLMPIYWAMPGRILSGAAAAAGLALINSVGSLSGVLGSLFIGYLGLHTGMYLLAAMLLVCGPVFYLAYPRPPIPET
jgi:predicted MFS family arabinose efflux permease